MADVVSELHYQNEEAAPVETVFVFPLDDEAAVYAFEGLIGGTRIEAQLQEKKKVGSTGKRGELWEQGGLDLEGGSASSRSPNAELVSRIPNFAFGLNVARYPVLRKYSASCTWRICLFAEF